MKKALVLLCCSVLPFGVVVADTAIETVQKAEAEAAAAANDQAQAAGNVVIMEKEVESAEKPREGIERYDQFEMSLKKAKAD